MVEPEHTVPLLLPLRAGKCGAFGFGLLAAGLKSNAGLGGV